MRVPLTVLVSLTLAVSACGSDHRPIGDGGGGDADADGDLECGDERLSVASGPQPIVNGSESWDPEVVDLTEGQALAVGALMTSSGGAWENVCTATLVAPSLVLTAAHCVLEWTSWPPGTIAPSRVRFAVGPDVATPVRTFDVTTVVRHAGYEIGWGGDARHDQAVLVLAEDAPTVLPGLEPVPVNCQPLERGSFVGQDVQNVGYGVTVASRRPPPNTRQYWTVEEVTDLTAGDFTVYGHGESAVCNGDSGGPSLWTMPDGVVRVVGTVSWGDPSCVDYDHFARVDDNCDLLRRFLPGCGEVSAAGSCDGQTAVFCEGEAVMRVDCDAMGRVCGDAGSGRMRCVDSTDPCRGETLVGRCEGETAVWCEDGRVQVIDCADRGMSCGVTAAGLFRCDGGDGGCDGETWQGRCEGETAVWCQDNEVRRRRCADCLQSCGWSDEHNGYYCL